MRVYRGFGGGVGVIVVLDIFGLDFGVLGEVGADLRGRFRGVYGIVFFFRFCGGLLDGLVLFGEVVF